MRHLRFYFTLPLALLLVAIATAAVPTSMNVQGRLTDAAGALVPAGVKTFTFKIFDAETLGSEIWPGGAGEDQTVVTDAAGLWTANVGALLGLTDPVFADSVRWLEVTVDDGVNPPEILPRVRLVTGPYAQRVSTVDGASGGVITSKVSIGSGHTNTGADAFVAGVSNTASGANSTVGGGFNNTLTVSGPPSTAASVTPPVVHTPSTAVVSQTPPAAASPRSAAALATPLVATMQRSAAAAPTLPVVKVLWSVVAGTTEPVVTTPLSRVAAD